MIQTVHVPGMPQFNENSVYMVEENLANELINRGQAEGFEPPEVETMVDQVDIKKSKK